MTTTAPATPAAAHALRDALAAFASPALFGGDELLDALTVLGDVQAELDAVKLRVVGELVPHPPSTPKPTTSAGGTTTTAPPT